MKELSPNEIDVWLACAIDTEGTIRVHIGNWGENGQPDHVWPVISFANSNWNIVEQFDKYAQFGTKISESTPQNKNSKQSYYSRTTKQEVAVQFIDRILPYLIVKKRQGEIIQQVFGDRLDLGNHQGVRIEYTMEQTEMLHEIEKLNQRGRRSDEN